jgi:hypothetical protein
VPPWCDRGGARDSVGALLTIDQYDLEVFDLLRSPRLAIRPPLVTPSRGLYLLGFP